MAMAFKIGAVTIAAFIKTETVSARSTTNKGVSQRIVTKITIAKMDVRYHILGIGRVVANNTTSSWRNKTTNLMVGKNIVGMISGPITVCTRNSIGGGLMTFSAIDTNFVFTPAYEACEKKVIRGAAVDMT